MLLYAAHRWDIIIGLCQFVLVQKYMLILFVRWLCLHVTILCSFGGHPSTCMYTPIKLSKY